VKKKDAVIDKRLAGKIQGLEARRPADAEKHRVVDVEEIAQAATMIGRMKIWERVFVCCGFIVGGPPVRYAQAAYPPHPLSRTVRQKKELFYFTHQVVSLTPTALNIPC